MALTLVTAPTDLPINLGQAKAQLRITASDEDALILGYIRAAVANLDGRDGTLGRALCTQTWELALDKFPAVDFIRLPLPPIQSITSVKYVDGDGVQQTFSSANYNLTADKGVSPMVRLAYGQSWPATRNQPDAVTVRYVAGYGAMNDVPETVRQALLLMVAHFYETRQPLTVGVSVMPNPMTVEFLLSPYRVWL